MEQKHTRSSSSNDKNNNNYSTQFDDLLGKTSKKLSKEEQDFIDRAAEAKRLQDEEASKVRQEEKEQYDKKKAQEFEDLASGKA